MVAQSVKSQGRPQDIYGNWFTLYLKDDYPTLCRNDMLYLDMWPVAPAQILVSNPDVVEQFTQARSMPKAPLVRRGFQTIATEPSIVDANGPEWREWRTIGNPAFAPKNLNAMMPAMVRECVKFRHVLMGVAEREEVIRLEDKMVAVTCDVIGHVVLDTSFGMQDGPVPLINVMLQLFSLISFTLNPQKDLNPWRYIKIRLLQRKFRRLVMPYVQKAFATKRGDDDEATTGRAKTLLSLAAHTHGKEAPEKAVQGQISRQFLDRLIANIIMFLFAGHDTSAITLCFTYYALSRRPDVVARLIEEHDAVLGSDAKQAADRIVECPNVLNQLHYTTAVIKETLRLWPVAGTLRCGSKHLLLTHPEYPGMLFPTEGFNVDSSVAAMHRNEKFWPQPSTFIPERFLTRDPNDPLHPHKNAFRAWELGPRNCIGQELALVEMRLILALTVRELEVIPTYPPDAPKFYGDPAYQCRLSKNILGHVKDGLPVRVKIRK